MPTNSSMQPYTPVLRVTTVPFSYNSVNYNLNQTIYDPTAIAAILASSTLSTQVDQSQVWNAVVIPSGQSLSNVLYLPGQTSLASVVIPASWTVGNLTFFTSVDGVNFSEVYDARNDEYTVMTVTNSTIPLDPSVFGVVKYIQVQSGTTASPVVQAASRFIAFNTK